MFNKKIQLAELIRILQLESYIFTTDPKSVDDILRHEKGKVTEKLLRRAKWIDSDQKLANQLDKIHQRLNLILWLASFFFFISGLLGSLSLLNSPTINFFYVLLCVLGANSLMLLLWLWMSFRSGSLFTLPIFHLIMRLNEKNKINKAISRLFNEQLDTPSIRWYLGKISHRFWLNTLLGMWMAIFSLLLVRQYHFLWESTLLSTDTVTSIIMLLSWLPERLGLSVPDSAIIASNRSINDTKNAHIWANLLLFSIFFYGIFPRLLAWLFCRTAWQRKQEKLPLNQPYYQNIIQYWQKKIIDADYNISTSKPMSKVVKIHQAEKWVCTLDTQWHKQNWYQYFLGQQWQNHGILAKQEDDLLIQQKMSQTPVQLLLGIRTQTLPDRGTMRRLRELHQYAQGGLIVQLLAEKTNSGSLNTRLNQWHKALAIEDIAWYDPPHIAQQNHAKDKL